MTGTLTLMRAREHTTYEWDTELVTSNGMLSKADIQAKFNEMMQSGGLAYSSTPEGSEQIKSSGFDPETQSQVTIIPQIAGGC
jgi:hypothetical protein